MYTLSIETMGKKIHSGLQVIHVKSCDHWVLASNLNTNANSQNL